MVLLAYLDPGDNKTPLWETALYVAWGVLVVLLVIYALTRFVVWAARR